MYNRPNLNRVQDFVVFVDYALQESPFKQQLLSGTNYEHNNLLLVEISSNVFSTFLTFFVIHGLYTNIRYVIENGLTKSKI